MKTLLLFILLCCTLVATSQVIIFQAGPYSNCTWNDITEDLTECNDSPHQPTTKFEIDTLKGTLKWISPANIITYTIISFEQSRDIGDYVVRNAAGSYFLYEFSDENGGKYFMDLLVWSCDAKGHRFLVNHNSNVVSWMLWK